MGSDRSVPDHCLYFYFSLGEAHCIIFCGALHYYSVSYNVRK